MIKKQNKETLLKNKQASIELTGKCPDCKEFLTTFYNDNFGCDYNNIVFSCRKCNYEITENEETADRIIKTAIKAKEKYENDKK